MTQKAAPSNGLGMAGFIVSLVGIFTLGLLCPIGLLLSFFGLFRRPRGMAFAGCVIGLIGSIVPLLIFLIFGFAAFSCLSVVSPMMGTEAVIKDARHKLDVYQATHGGVFPSEAEGQMMMASEKDAWGHSLLYRRMGIGYELRSAGPDGVFGTEDDIPETVEGPPR